MRLLVDRLVHHLHAYAQDTGLTHAEWREGIAFLHRSASITTPSRSEFTLISDVLRPFHTRGSPWMQSGANLINGNAGAAVVVRGQVTDIGGQALPGAALDFWQNADNGMYWQQDQTQPQDNLRCQMKVDSDGHFELVSTRPQPYPVPTDGPVGELLRTPHRNAWRPAHFHVIVEAPGYRSLITEVFDAEDPYVENDAVFGVRASLVAHFKTESHAEVARRYQLPASYLVVDLPVRLALVA